MSEFKTDKISPRSGTTQTIGDSGDSVSTSSGSTINNAGTITTAGITGGTINNTTGSIYLRGEVDWQPSDIKTASFTATDNQGFFVNTTSGEITITLPASPSAGDVVGIKDYANTFDTNKCILNANGNKIQGSTELFEITVEGSSIIIIYVDATQGWVITDASKAADISEAPSFINATGGTITTCGNDKIHTFTGPGTFTVCSVGNPLGGPNSVDYLVVAAGAGGGGGGGLGGGGGAGGYRTSFPSPLGTLPVSATGYPITVGSGGTAGGPGGPGSNGNNSIFLTITSTGGGGGGSTCVGPFSGQAGGSGGGGGTNPSPQPGGAGNTPPVSPSQGNSGGSGFNSPASIYSSGGGGGIGGIGNNATPTKAGNGGAGTTNSITGSSIAYAGGGGGGSDGPGVNGGCGGAGGGGKGRFGPGAPCGASGETAGAANTGGGGGGGVFGAEAGGSGIVIIRYKFQ